MEESVSQLLDGYTDTMVFSGPTALIWVIVGLAAYYLGILWLKKRRDQRKSMADYDISGDVGPDVDPLDPLYIPQPVMRRAARPTEGGAYAAIRAFAEEKHRVGDALIEEERFAIGPVAVAAGLLGDAGLAQMDSYGANPPYKGWELRQAMERIGVPQIGALLEDAVAVFLHRHQLITDMTDTGMPLEQARTHPDMPQYDPLDEKIRQAGGLAAFQAAADQYFDTAYPWADHT